MVGKFKITILGRPLQEYKFDPFSRHSFYMNKLHTVLGKLGEFCADIAQFWLEAEVVGSDQFVNTNFTKLRMEIVDPNHIAYWIISPCPSPMYGMT